MWAQESVRAKEAAIGAETESVIQRQQLYESTKERRVALQKSIKSQVQTCNELIRVENETFRDIQPSLVKKNKLQKELQEMNRSLKTCSDLVASYNSFMEQNIKYIAKINLNFQSSWAQFEARWTQWTAEDLSAWFQYKAADLSGDRC